MERGIRVKNRDVITLARVPGAMADVKTAEKRRLWMQDRLWNITQKITGMPSGHGAAGGLEGRFAEISEMEEIYREKLDESLKALKEAEVIVNAIRSPGMRTFVVMRYMLDMSRREIMRELNIKRWKYMELCNRIEEAQDMAHVNWPEHYILWKDES